MWSNGGCGRHGCFVNPPNVLWKGDRDVQPTGFVCIRFGIICACFNLGSLFPGGTNGHRVQSHRRFLQRGQEKQAYHLGNQKFLHWRLDVPSWGHPGGRGGMKWLSISTKTKWSGASSSCLAGRRICDATPARMTTADTDSRLWFTPSQNGGQEIETLSEETGRKTHLSQSERVEQQASSAGKKSRGNGWPFQLNPPRWYAPRRLASLVGQQDNRRNNRYTEESRRYKGETRMKDARDKIERQKRQVEDLIVLVLVKSQALGHPHYIEADKLRGASKHLQHAAHALFLANLCLMEP